MLRSCGGPKGPYLPFAPPITPNTWFCLDGHLYFGESFPQLVFCREWLEVGDGEIYSVALSGDLTHMVDEPIRLFAASEASWTRPIDDSQTKYITDGPFLWKSRATHELLMLWSSIGENGAYNVRYTTLRVFKLFRLTYL